MKTVFFVSASLLHCDVTVVDVAGAQSKWLTLWTFPYLESGDLGKGTKAPVGFSFLFVLFYFPLLASCKAPKNDAMWLEHQPANPFPNMENRSISGVY